MDAVKTLCIEAAHVLPEDVLLAIRSAIETETDARARGILESLIENAKIAREQLYPLCQDTGLTVIFIDQGNEVVFDSDNISLYDAINEGVQAGYQQGYLRKSVVYDPVKERKNTNTNTPAIIHHRLVSGDKLSISVMLKGGGCENRSQFRMLKPADGETGVMDFIVETVKSAGADACPPFVVGVGIGGDFELSCLIAKRALLKNIGTSHQEPFYAEMEQKLLERINRLGIGPMGMGGQTTAIAVQIETAPCHIASVPVAVNIECHSHRHKTVVI